MESCVYENQKQSQTQQLGYRPIAVLPSPPG
jgi:hypothetical protein